MKEGNGMNETDVTQNEQNDRQQETEPQETSVVVVNEEGEPTATVTFTQEQVSSIAAKEKRQGRASAYGELGIDPDDEEAINLVKAVLAGRASLETPDADEAARQLDEATHRAEAAEAKMTVMMAGVLPKYVDDAMQLALGRVKDGTSLEDAVKDLKPVYPMMFGGAEGAKGDAKGASKGSKGTGSSIGGSSAANSGEKSGSLGKRLAASHRERDAKAKNSSYWN